MNLEPFIERLKARHRELESLLGAPDLYHDPRHAQELTREHRHTTEALAVAARLEEVERDIAGHENLLVEGTDPDLIALVQEELPNLRAEADKLRLGFRRFIVPPDPDDSRNTIVEIRAGTGGDEAGLFAADLYRMYARFAERVGWTLDLMDASTSGAGGYREIVFSLTGEDVFKHLRYESGVHRVQRVPVTENQGRIHTSTATVAVLPEAEEVDLVIKPEELRIEVCRAGGPGGQGVNTTDSAVQILHIPTGMIVRCQDGRSQIKNKEKALSILRSRLLEQKQNEEKAKYAANRKQQIGTGDRNERIRTYNFPQNRLTDHRINLTLYNLTTVMEGDLTELFDQLQAYALALKLEGLELS
ncbi:MAG: peptide chain release factor 1 [Candidatus Methylacidiphilales bacterium]